MPPGGTFPTWRRDIEVCVRNLGLIISNEELGDETANRDVSYWHEPDQQRCPQFGRYRRESGHAGGSLFR
jgi:hypothetical protein